MNQGSTIAAISGTPTSGRSRTSQRASRSTMPRLSDGQAGDHHHDRTLDQDAETEPDPEAERRPERRRRGAIGQIDARERPLREQNGREQHGIGLGEVGFGGEDQREPPSPPRQSKAALRPKSGSVAQ